MRKFVYFIEKPDTGEWFCTEWGTKQEFGYAMNSYNMPSITYTWTNDPMKAQQFESREMAESLAKHLYYYDLKDIHWIVTEHEFVIN